MVSDNSLFITMTYPDRSTDNQDEYYEITRWIYILEDKSHSRLNFFTRQPIPKLATNEHLYNTINSTAIKQQLNNCQWIDSIMHENSRFDFPTWDLMDKTIDGRSYKRVGKGINAVYLMYGDKTHPTMCMFWVGCESNANIFWW